MLKSSLVPRLPDLFNIAREKRRNLVKLITCVMSGGTNFHIWHNSELAGLRHRISHRKFELFNLNVTIGYESASRGPSVPLVGVENCDLHSNSIVPTSKLVPPGCSMDTIKLSCKLQFLTHSEGAEASPIVDSQPIVTYSSKNSNFQRL